MRSNWWLVICPIWPMSSNTFRPGAAERISHWEMHRDWCLDGSCCHNWNIHSNGQKSDSRSRCSVTRFPSIRGRGFVALVDSSCIRAKQHWYQQTEAFDSFTTTDEGPGRELQSNRIGGGGMTAGRRDGWMEEWTNGLQAGPVAWRPTTTMNEWTGCGS